MRGIVNELYGSPPELLHVSPPMYSEDRFFEMPSVAMHYQKDFIMSMLAGIREHRSGEFIAVDSMPDGLGVSPTHAPRRKRLKVRRQARDTVMVLNPITQAIRQAF